MTGQCPAVYSFLPRKIIMILKHAKILIDEPDRLHIIISKGTCGTDTAWSSDVREVLAKVILTMILAGVRHYLGTRIETLLGADLMLPTIKRRPRTKMPNRRHRGQQGD